MPLSRREGMRWVVLGVQPDTIRKAKLLAATHDVLLNEVLEEAVDRLYDEVKDGDYLPTGWTDARI